MKKRTILILILIAIILTAAVIYFPYYLSNQNSDKRTHEDVNQRRRYSILYIDGKKSESNSEYYCILDENDVVIATRVCEYSNSLDELRKTYNFYVNSGPSFNYHAVLRDGYVASNTSLYNGKTKQELIKLMSSGTRVIKEL